MSVEKDWYLYILECRDHTLYTGITNDLPRRLSMHAAGKGAKYTRGRAPLKLSYSERCEDHSAALRRELEIKRMPKSEKLLLCATYQDIKNIEVNTLA